MSSSAAGANGSTYDYDMVTIGAGSGGVRCSRVSSSQYNAKVCVVELPFGFVSGRDTGGAGGTCVLRGCVPKKLLIYGGELRHQLEDARGMGWRVAEDAVSHDWAELQTKKNNELLRLNGIYKKLLSNAGVDYVEGRAKIVDKNTIAVSSSPNDPEPKMITAKNILVAVGGTPFKPAVPGAEELTITSDEALQLETCPKSIVIVGGGYIALEFAGIFHSFGADVHVVMRQPTPLRGFDEDVRSFLMDQMVKQGITFHAGESPASIEEIADGKKRVTFQSGGSIDTEVVMMATGRRPNTHDLGLESVGIDMEKNGAIKVDSFSRTNVDGIFAIGDVTDRINLTPVALHEGMCLARTLFADDGDVPCDHENVASAVFSDPQVATVGLTEAQACERFPNVDVYESTFRPMKNTISGSELKMLMKLLVDADTDRVVGVHVVGPDAGEMMQGVGIAVKMGATKKDFDMTIGIHPTAAEELVTMRSVSRKIRREASVEKETEKTAAV